MQFQTIEGKRKSRAKLSAENFTPSLLVNEILDKLNEYGPESWQENKSFCDPACGNGNILIEVLKRKLTYNHDPFIALKTIYGTDIMDDNIKECRLRLIKVTLLYMKKNNIKRTKQILIDLIKIVGKNIVCTPLKKYPKGSLDYDFEFSHSVSDKQAQDGLYKILHEKMLKNVTV